MIHPEHLEAAGNPIIPKDAPFEGPRFEAFKKLATEGKKRGSLITGQLSHPGRQTPGDLQPNPVSASDVQLENNPMGKFGKPTTLTQDGIKDIVDSFAHAAEYLHKAGYDGAQLHGAHGYLLSQFLSPTTNQREDKYGGSLENRSRIIFEIAKAVQDRTSKTFSLSIKLNSVEFQGIVIPANS
jgi:2,4-dienoyl-CoA reductase-like NADH-dependent reductase (Old Yellow Enzyme family)